MLTCCTYWKPTKRKGSHWLDLFCAQTDTRQSPFIHWITNKHRFDPFLPVSEKLNSKILFWKREFSENWMRFVKVTRSLDPSAPDPNFSFISAWLRDDILYPCFNVKAHKALVQQHFITLFQKNHKKNRSQSNGAVVERNAYSRKWGEHRSVSFHVFLSGDW